MEYLLFVLYLVLFAWLVTRVKFFTQSGLSNSQLVILFLLKVLAGIFYGWMGIYYSNLARMADTWAFHRFGIEEYHLLFSDPYSYVTNLFHNPYEGGGVDKFFGSENSYWNDLKGNVFVKLLSVFDIFSFGNYYINVIFFSFLTLFGPVAIFRFMSDVYPGRKIAIALAAFLIPSFLYWTSGLHKEGLIFTGISFIIYHLYFGRKERRYTIVRWLGILGGLFLLLILRNFLMLLVVPAILAWLITVRCPRYGLVIFIFVYFCFGTLFFFAKYLDPRFDFPAAVVTKQRAFLELQGGSTIPVKKLEPTLKSFLKNTPQAFAHTVFRPYPGDVRNLPTLISTVEVSLLLLLTVFLFVFSGRKFAATSKNAVWLCRFLAFSILLAIGFSINNLGAIVRYRSIVIPLLMVPVVAQTDWKKIAGLFQGKKKNSETAVNL